MKRFLVVFLVLSMLLAGISAAFAQDAPAEIVVPEGRILVKYWSPYGSGSSAWIDENAINVFNAAQDKYFVVREYNGGYYDQIAKLMATEQKDLPAFCNSSSSTVSGISNLPIELNDCPSCVLQHIIVVHGHKPLQLLFPFGHRGYQLAICSVFC